MPAEPVMLDGRRVGWANDGVYKTHRNQARHLYRKFRSYGIDLSVLTDLAGRGVHTIQISEKTAANEWRVYNTPLPYWREHGRRVKYGGHEQVHVPRDTIIAISDAIPRHLMG